jgi:glucose-1-phosphate thymidylyltransferase
MTTPRRGIILAGGSGTRLWPITLGVSKQLLPLYDKPMIYYPLSVLMLTGIREIAVITTPQDRVQFERMLGDNVFFGHGLIDLLVSACDRDEGATVFGYRVADPERYGVIDFEPDGRVRAIVEKPEVPPSSLAVTGLYFLDGTAPERARRQVPSARGELEITDLLQTYLDDGVLRVEQMGRGYAWLDTGTHASLLDAGNFVRTLSERQGQQIGSPDEVAFQQGWIDAEALRARARKFGKTEYGRALARLAE